MDDECAKDVKNRSACRRQGRFTRAGSLESDQSNSLKIWARKFLPTTEGASSICILSQLALLTLHLYIERLILVIIPSHVHQEGLAQDPSHPRGRH